jgi:nucleoside-diphosphate-sugar epimerase
MQQEKPAYRLPGRRQSRRHSCEQRISVPTSSTKPDAIETNVIRRRTSLPASTACCFSVRAASTRATARSRSRRSISSAARSKPTNEPYAIAKIAGIEMCWSYNRQYGTRFLAAMPTNLYGPGDNYHPDDSHVIPALIRKFHEAKQAKALTVSVWGTGTPRREFMYSEDMADACIFLMNLPDDTFNTLLGSEEAATGIFMPPVVNIGVGEDLTIRELAATVKSVVGYSGEIEFDSTKPDGTPRKLMDVKRLTALGWRAPTAFDQGLRNAYKDALTTGGIGHHGHE